MATIFAPDAMVSMRDSAVFYGRVMARTISLSDYSSVYAKPDDGQRIGLSANQGPHRDDSGRLKEVVLAEDRTSVQTMVQIAEELGATVTAGGDTVQPAVPELAVAETASSEIDKPRKRRWRGKFGRSGFRRYWAGRSWRRH